MSVGVGVWVLVLLQVVEHQQLQPSTLGSFVGRLGTLYIPIVKKNVNIPLANKIAYLKMTNELSPLSKLTTPYYDMSCYQQNQI